MVWWILRFGLGLIAIAECAQGQEFLLTGDVCADKPGVDCSTQYCKAVPGQFLCSCQKTCGNCAGTICRDSTSIPCPQYAEKGYCFTAQVREYCPKSCNACTICPGSITSSSTTSTTSSSTSTTTSSTTTTTTTTPIPISASISTPKTTRTGVSSATHSAVTPTITSRCQTTVEQNCTDFSSTCSLELCHIQPGLYLHICRKTCDNCDGCQCYDTTRPSVNCKDLLENGFCSQSTFQQYCPKSCGICSSLASTSLELKTTPQYRPTRQTTTTTAAASPSTSATTSHSTSSTTTITTTTTATTFTTSTTSSTSTVTSTSTTSSTSTSRTTTTSTGTSTTSVTTTTTTTSTRSPCPSTFCLNGGTCFFSDKGYRCQCPTQWIDTTCSLRVCSVKIENSGAYLLRTSFKSFDNKTESTVISRGKSYSAVVLVNHIMSFEAVSGKSKSILVTPEICPSSMEILCTGTTIIDFDCEAKLDADSV